MEKKQKTPKEKRRNMERRKEKSRDAARCRRSKETEIFTDLSSMLPFSKNDNVSHLDKASIIRIAISYLKIRTIVKSLPILKTETREIVDNRNADALFLNALEGFLLVTSADGDIVFISENVNRFLGLTQVDVLGQSIYELSHPCDHAEIKEMLSIKDLNAQKSYFLRMKCTLTSKGRNVNIKSASYKVIQFTGRVIENHNKQCFDNMKKEQNSTSEYDSSDSNKSDEFRPVEGKVVNTSAYYFVSVGEPISHPANIEIPLGRNTFLTKHSLDMKFTYADERIVDFFGYNTNALLEKSVFDYHHAEDSVSLRNCFKNLFQKGQSQTERYRFLASGGGYAWVLTQATVIYSSSSKPQSVVCVNFVISGIENKDEIYSLCQLETDGSGISSVTSVETNVGDDGAVNEVNDRYGFENSPQNLIEKLCIDNTTGLSLPSSPPSSTTLPSSLASPARVEKVRAAAAAVRRRCKSIYGIDSGADTENSEILLTEERKIGSIQLPSVCDFLINCSSSPATHHHSCSDTSTSTTSIACTSPAPTSCRVPINPEWLMTDNKENVPVFESSSPVPINLNENLNSAKFEIPRSEAPKISTLDIIGNNNVNNCERIFPIAKLVPTVPEAPKPATVNVFVPFTKEMDTGFLGFFDDNKKPKMLTGDEDLTHLAPQAGDLCVSLDENPVEYVLPDVLDEVMLSDCKLLPNDNVDRNFSSPSSAFFNYRDGLEPSSRPLSPILTQNEDCSIPSLCSDDSPLHNNTVSSFLDFHDLMNSSDEIDDLSAKSSLLPLTLEHDAMLPFVTNDFMWGSSSEESPWSSVSSSPTSSNSLSPRVNQNSSLAKLLTSNPISNYDGGGGEDGGGGDNRIQTGLSDGGNKRTSANHNDSEIVERNSYSVSNRTGERNYSNVVNFIKTGSTNQRSNLNNNQDGSKRRCTNSISKMEASSDTGFVPSVTNFNIHNFHHTSKKDISSRSEDRRKNGGNETLVGTKRSSSENWSRANSCKRSRQTSRLIIISAGNGVTENNKRMSESAAATAAAKQTNSVLMNLLVSGCDLNAGYEEDYNRTLLNRDNENDNQTYEYSTVKDVSNPVDFSQWANIKRRFFRLLVPESSKIPSLMDLTERDYAVNAPSAGKLLQGSELLKALECSETLNLR